MGVGMSCIKPRSGNRGHSYMHGGRRFQVSGMCKDSHIHYQYQAADRRYGSNTQRWLYTLNLSHGHYNT